MKPPGFEPEDGIGDHVDDMHYGPVEVCPLPPKCPHVLREYFGDVLDLPYPMVFNYLRDIIENETIKKSVEIRREGNENNHGY
jgi:hypothetical protein